MNCKKGITGLFLAALICICCCYYIPFYFQKKEIRKEMKRAISNSLGTDELVKLSFTAEELKMILVEDGKEIIYKGDLFDIVKLEQVADRITVYVLEDKKEKEIYKDLDELVSNYLGQNKANNSPMKALGKMVSLKFLTTKKLIKANCLPAAIKKNYLQALLLYPQSGHLAAPFTPPELI